MKRISIKVAPTVGTMYYVLTNNERDVTCPEAAADSPRSYCDLSIHPTKADARIAVKHALAHGSEWAIVLKPIEYANATEVKE